MGFLQLNRKGLVGGFSLCSRSPEHDGRVKNSSRGRSKEPLDRLWAWVKLLVRFRHTREKLDSVF